MEKDITEITMVHRVACGLCDAPNAAYDARLKSGPWAYLCESCFKKHGVGLGTGRGQKIVYRLPHGR